MSALTHEEWTDALREGDLLGVTCTDCERVYATPLFVCDDCGSRDLETTTLPREGEVYSETTIQVSPIDFDAPYQVGMVEVDGAKVMARLEGDAAIGDRVVFDDVQEVDGDLAPVFRVD
ncbi:Zn-ribbon domain-containing OB-fold protein [Halomarina salina]|uniref:Zn-ribbon domain-containing OB-fold protein n=1 Tax=Halomarina salina TaxID=1872699 RepID=A0ABD5RQV3_9EURY|nr:OB-fold domain-containing protein [Halomarina salina]